MLCAGGTETRKAASCEESQGAVMLDLSNLNTVGKIGDSDICVHFVIVVV
jgi:hypothetical protein